MLASAGNLLVTFPRAGEDEQVQIALTGEKALTTALIMLLLREDFRAGNCLTVQQSEPANRLEMSLGSPSSDDQASGGAIAEADGMRQRRAAKQNLAGGPVHS